ncbi:CDP-diacylglycerol--glycerol-3-phosphate 3-phosphatidyltransferase [Anaerosphaera aminiphila DSM 21120]|uniref:CDP-diacylglycerol--glycerol-3-phosphate 3-phosphatidyltransferase n=1 Tax=Anaerosphaera aminiphila DSM 21120 TaxID=1120995 RepID=A0A1M5TCM3_9FIRM|nr:CDP-alcohol phosphatidyltransferase family protein [Anaerosphaera aminiphila]SHH48517.1 CDP-diacylglycerol--glycerol-3-phosphate 3-phosphatidyltransferase [Anaerosphaera aminiphila DSM 21120]
MRHIPNLLSLFRIVLLPFFVWQMFSGNTFYAGIILLISALTDFLDGNLARKFGWITDLGKILDPIADKITQFVVSITLAILLRRYWGFFAIIIIKDIVILLAGGYLLKKGIKLEGAKWFGKISTFIYYFTSIVIILFPSLPNTVIVTLLTLAVVFALISVLLYIPEFIKYKNKKD